MMRRPPTSTLFPYTRLFRSRPRGVLRIRGRGPARSGSSVSSAASTPLDQSAGQPVPPSVDAAHLERVLFEIKRVIVGRSEEHTSELQSRQYLVCGLLLEKEKLCGNAGVSIVPQGGNTGLVGEAGAEGEVIVSLTRMNAIRDRKSTRLNSSHANILYAVFS